MLLPFWLVCLQGKLPTNSIKTIVFSRLSQAISSSLSP
jgi:hypothetical protein